MNAYIPILEKCPLFSDINNENLLAMLGCLGASYHEYKKDAPILSEGDPAGIFGIVLTGSVRIIRIDFYGNRTIVANISPTQLFGESFACAGIETLPVNIVASSDCSVLLMDARRITRTCSNSCEFHSRIIFNLLKIVAAKNLVFNQKNEITSQRTTREKLMAYLLSEAKSRGSREFDIPYSRQELADYLEVDRSGLSTEIGKLVREGILSCSRSHFVLQ